MNTYGLRSINTTTFNLQWHTNYTYPKALRDHVVTFFRVHNLALNILGYIPGISLVSGCVRIASGLAISITTLAIGDRNAQRGAIIGHWYDEALLTGISQVARGVLEAFVPFGWIANAVMDMGATCYNIGQEISTTSTCTGCMEYSSHGPHPDPEYPFLLRFLNLA